MSSTGCNIAEMEVRKIQRSYEWVKMGRRNKKLERRQEKK